MDGRAAGALAAEAADDYIGSGTEVSNYFHISDLTNYAGRGVPAWRDHCYFGLLREDDYSPKPSYSAMQTLATMYMKGQIKPVIDQTLPMKNLPKAYAIMGSRSVKGKLVLVN